MTKVITAPALTPAPPRTNRLAWLDALRGAAALIVVFEHAMQPLLPELRAPVKAVIDPGFFGVLVFFLVSGFIIPASLERRGSVGGFWISRVFRLWPLWAVCVAGVLALVALGWSAHVWWQSRPLAMALAHVTMLQNLLVSVNMVNVMWTLSFEMAFYLLVTSMFTLGVHRRSLSATLAFSAAALVGAWLLPAALLLGEKPSAERMLAVTVVVTLLLAAGLTAVLAGRDAVRRGGAVLLAATVLVLLAGNQRYPGPGLGFLIIATMFAGTVLYRAERGELPWRLAAWTAVVPVTGVVICGVWGDWGKATAIAAAWCVFAVAMRARRRRVPGALVWLGTVSYSVYLLHPLLLQAGKLLLGPMELLPLGVRLLVLAVLTALLLGLSAVTWRWVETPAQRLGRRVSRRLVRQS